MPQVLSRFQSHGHSHIQDQSDSKHDNLANLQDERALQNEMNDPNKLILSGYLYKKSARYHNYKRRWFVLRNGQLSYYKDESEHRALGVIHAMRLLSANVDDAESHHHKDKFYFKIHTDQKVFQLYANDEATLNHWMKDLKYVMELNSKGSSDSEESDIGEIIDNDPTALEQPDFIEQFHNNSSAEMFTGTEDPNYTSNASDTNLNILSSSMSRTLPPISEKKLDYAKVESEREKLTTKILNRNMPHASIKNDMTDTEKERKAQLNKVLNPTNTLEIVIEKGQMSRLYKRYNQWKKFFIILTNKKLIFYKYSSALESREIEDIIKSEKPSKIIKVTEILDIVELEALSKTKPWCLLIICKEKRLRFSVENEEALIKWLVAITMLKNSRENL